MKRVYIHNDEEACIVLTKDHHNGICIQLGVYTETQVPNHENLMIVARNLKIIKSNIVQVSAPNFKSLVAEKIKEAQAELVQIQKSHQILDGVLNDYLSQNRELNEPERQ